MADQKDKVAPKSLNKNEKDSGKVEDKGKKAGDVKEQELVS